MMMETNTGLVSGDSTSPVVSFYSGKNIFITGATGFMGKVLVYKLLKECSDIGSLYLLIRPKSGVDVEDRLQHLLSNVIFSEMSKTQLDKVVAVAGDITLPKLGICDQDERLLIDTVSVIFHSAATIKFDEELTKSVLMNIGGTRCVLDLARKMSQLKSLVHVSTAFSHCYNSHIEEKAYTLTSASPNSLIDLCKAAENAQLLNDPYVTKKVIGIHPNTYTFTKALAEQLLAQTASDLPIVIIRPSIVVAAWKEPFPGWVDNLHGATGMVAGAASGLLRSILVKQDYVADVVPVDMAINLMCVAATVIDMNNNDDDDGNDNPEAKTKPISFYNFSSGSINPITWREIRDKAIPGLWMYPFQKSLWYPHLRYQNNQWVDKISQAALHTTPAFIVDSGMRLMGKKPFLGNIVTKMHKATEALKYFSNRQWKWDTANMEKLETNLDCADKKKFQMNPKVIDWNDFMKNYIHGTGRFVLKDDPSSYDASRRKLWMMYWVNLATVFTLVFVFVNVLATSKETFEPLGQYSILFSLFAAIVEAFNAQV